MNKEEIKIITLGDIFRNLETEEQAFEFLKYIKNLQQENQELKKQFEAINEQANYLRKSVERKEETIIDLQNERVPYTNEYVTKLENQQKEFIEYLEDLIKQNETVVEVSKYGLPKNCSKLLIDFYKEILSKYKEIIGDVKSENK